MLSETLMTSKYVILILLLLNQISSTAQNKPRKNDWATENLLGKVKTVKQTCYRAIDKSGEIIKGIRIDNSLKKNYAPPEYVNDYTTYHKSGYIEVKYVYNADDSLLSKVHHKYDNNWNLLEVNDYDSNNVLETKSTYKYDDKGNRIESKSSYGSGKVYYRDISKYDDKGNEIETIAFDMNKLPSRTTYKYDDKGNQVELTFYDSRGKYDGKIIYEYDNKGHVVEYNSYNPDGSARGGKSTNKYDDNENLVEQSSYNKDGSLDRKWAFKFDNRGNMLEWGWYGAHGKHNGTLTYGYTYDNKGNWIRKICLIDNMPDCIYEREMEYYE